MSDATLYYRTEDTQNGTPKIDALKTAVDSFINSVRTDADTYNLDHKIAIVGFASESDYGNNTEILSISGDNSIISGTYNRKLGKAYKKLNTVDYQSALKEAENNILDDAVDALSAEGATRTDLGMQIAENILKNRQTTTVAIDGKSYERPTVVIMFTDGTPTTYDSFDSSVANNTVTYAGSMKAGLTVGSGQNEKKLQPTNVYTVGIFNGADASANPTAPSTSNENKFMQAVSSNYPNATKYYDLGEKNPAVTDGKSYYLSAGDGDALNQAFQSIAENIGGGAEAELDETSVMYDKMSQYFKLPDGAGDKISAEVWQTTDGGKSWMEVNGEGEKLTVSIEGDIVKVTGFDYSKWYVANDHIGRKVVVTIPIEYKGAECFGGNNIPTNSNTSGMYTSDGKECYGNFEVPAVNNRINYEINSKDQTIYITNQGVLANLLAYSDGYVPNGTKNAFVTITYTLKDSQENVLGTLTIPAGSAAADASWNWSGGGDGLSQKLYECTKYTLTCKVSPVWEEPATYADGTVIGKEATETTCTPENNPVIHVVTPDIRGKDQFIFLGDIAAFGEDETWSRSGWSDKIAGHTNIPAVTGTAPQLEITPVLVAGTSLTDQGNYYPEKDSDFNIQVEVGTGDITRYCGITGDTSTAHGDCIGNESAAEHKFTIHVIGGKIQLYKQISGTVNAATEGNAVFTFKVTYTSPQNTQEVNYYTIEFKDNNNGERALVAELDNLKKGTYSIEELDTQRYDKTEISSDGSTGVIVKVQNKTAEVTIGSSSSKSKQTGVITYTNTKNQDPGSLTDTDVVINRFTYSNSGNGYTFSQEEPTQVENKSIVSKAADFLSEAFN